MLDGTVDMQTHVTDSPPRAPGSSPARLWIQRRCLMSQRSPQQFEDQKPLRTDREGAAKGACPEPLWVTAPTVRHHPCCLHTHQLAGVSLVASCPRLPSPGVSQGTASRCHVPTVPRVERIQGNIINLFHLKLHKCQHCLCTSSR